SGVPRGRPDPRTRGATMRLLTLTGMLAALAVPAGRAEEKKEELPVKAKLVSKKPTYTVEAGQTGDAFRKLLKAAEKSGKTPPPPAVEMTLEITNTSDKEIKIWNGGDPVQLDLVLTGPGAVNVMPLLAFTTDFRGPMATVLGPGKTMSIPVTK